MKKLPTQSLKTRTEADIERKLTVLFNEGFTYSEIGAALSLGRDAVVWRARKLGLKRYCGEDIGREDVCSKTLHNRTYNRRHPEKRRAHKLTESALQRGVLARPNRCSECGAVGPVEAHHKDYSRQLWVVWLCSGCHRNETYGTSQP